MFFLNGTLKKGGSVGRWEMKQFIGMVQEYIMYKHVLSIYLEQNDS